MLPAWVYPAMAPRIEERSEFFTLRFALRHPILPVTGSLMADAGWTQPPFHRIGYREWDRDMTVFAWVGLHWLLRLYQTWERHRWAAERIGTRWGFYDLAEGDYYSNGHWTLNARRVWEQRIAKAMSVRSKALDREYQRGIADGERDFIERCLAQLDDARKQIGTTELSEREASS